jgi:hypothetical protein
LLRYDIGTEKVDFFGRVVCKIATAKVCDFQVSGVQGEVGELAKSCFDAVFGDVGV